jgi:hypothetical protein
LGRTVVGAETASPGDGPSAPSADDAVNGHHADAPLHAENGHEDLDEERARAFLAGGAYATVAIDRYDDLPAIFGKLDAAASPRVALVAARGNHELQKPLSMRRLLRHLDLTGKDVILVSRSRGLRIRAHEESMPAVGSLRRVNFQTYGRRGLRLGWLTLRLPSLGAVLGLLVLAAAFAGGAAVLFWYLPTAEVMVYLPTTTLEETLDVTLDGQATNVNAAAMTVPARRREVTITRNFYRQATGTQVVPQTSAAVGLRFANRTFQPVRVPQGTVVIAQNGMRFVTGNDVDLPRQNAVADVVALAQEPGTRGNVPPNSITRVEGDLAARVSVTNPAAGEKGSDLTRRVVTEGDIEGVRTYADPVLIDAARHDLTLRLAETATVFDASAAAQVTEIVATPPAGSVAQFTDVRVTGKASMLTVDNLDLRQLYIGRFRPMLAPDQMLLDREFRTTPLANGEPDRAFDRLPVTIRAEAYVAPLMDGAALRAALAGKSKAQAAEALAATVELPQPPTIKMTPNWAPNLPRVTDRITIVYAPAPPVAAAAP